MNGKRGMEQAPVTMPPERPTSPPAAPPPPGGATSPIDPGAIADAFERAVHRELSAALSAWHEHEIESMDRADREGRVPLGILGSRGRIVNRAPARDRFQALMQPTRDKLGAAQSWYRIENRASGSATIYIYDEIGFWGVTASDFVAELGQLDVSTIDLHISSPGGEVYDGIAIYNALKQHKAAVNVFIDALAASAASFIAQAGTTVVIARNAEMMIHDAMGAAFGNSGDFRELAGALDRVSDNIADIYAQRAGGTKAQWRDRMRAETWYTAAEAVTAGLADSQTDPDPETENVSNRWGGLFQYANRMAAPPPSNDATQPTGPPAPPGPWDDGTRPDPEPLPDDPPEALFDLASLFHAAIDLGMSDPAAPPLDTPAPAAPATRVPAFPADILRQAVKGARDGA